MKVDLIHGLPPSQRRAAAELYWQAFGGKLARVMGPEPRALDFLLRVMRSDHAIAAVEAGCDIVVAQGTEAGGHTGQVATFALVPQVVDAVGDRVPVVAAGGIVDGRGMAAAMLMGAAGVQMGTRFLLTDECGFHPKAKAAVMNAVDTDSVVTGFSRDAGVRGLRNQFTEKFLQLETSGAPREELDRFATGTNRAAAVDGDVENGMVQCGQSLMPLREIRPVREVIETIMADTRRILLHAPELLQ